jgi:hypothetical protein
MNSSHQKMESIQAALEDFLSEPLLGWFCAQFLYFSQPVLSAFWGKDQITSWAERFAGETAPLPDVPPTFDSR